MNQITPIGAQPNLGFILPPFQTFSEWNDLGKSLCLAGRNIDWLIGDWLNAGVEKFGDRKALDRANEIFRTDRPRFSEIQKTCQRFPPPARHPKLSFGHHKAVLSIKDSGEAESILVDAEAQRLSVAEVKAKVQVACGRAQSQMLPDDDPEDKFYREIIQAANRTGSPSARQMAVEAIIEANYGVVDL